MTTDLYSVVVDSISAQVAILDGNGIIVETNRAWRVFGQANGMPPEYESIGANYLLACTDSGDHSQEEATRVAEGIRRVLNGELDEFMTEYPCHSPDRRRWYVVRVVPYRDAEFHRVIVTHEDITPIMEVQEALRRKEKELRRERERLEEANIALRVLLDQREEDRKRVEETIYANVEQLVLPHLGAMGQGQLSARHRTLLDLAEMNLRDIVSPFLHGLKTLHQGLTPQEIEVANMVRGGKSSKEIAEVMNISVAGVDFHRKNLRRKLGLASRRHNLRSYLLSLR